MKTSVLSVVVHRLGEQREQLACLAALVAPGDPGVTVVGLAELVPVAPSHDAITVGDQLVLPGGAHVLQQGAEASEAVTGRGSLGRIDADVGDQGSHTRIVKRGGFHNGFKREIVGKLGSVAHVSHYGPGVIKVKSWTVDLCFFACFFRAA